ncbi:MAG: FAD-dependent oxidoreductase, partial [Anaerolineales bacterium]|nr:FAD-dependent oxidoreductase [Anaerolineales bacterium]
VENSNFSIAADTAVLALGYWHDPIIGKTTPDLKVDEWGKILMQDKFKGTTSREGVFTGGDCATGPDLVVTAMVGGRKAAIAIDEYLRNKK